MAERAWLAVLAERARVEMDVAWRATVKSTTARTAQAQLQNVTVLPSLL